MDDRIRGQGITFDDVLLVPARSDVHPSEVSTATLLTRRIPLNVPLVSAAMDTVTESGLAIALAQEGGLGVIHKNLSPAAQALEVEKVKRSENGVITDPVTLPPNEPVGRARQIMGEQNISGLPIVEGKKLAGILTRRDLRFQGDDRRPIGEVMTRPPLVTAPPQTTLEQAKEILFRNKVEKLLLVDEQFQLRGLITNKDIDKIAQYPHACRDERGRLRVGAAVGVYDEERTARLIASGVDVLAVDTAHGHSSAVLETVRWIKRQHKIEVIAGNVVTAEGARELAEAGADAIKVGVGPGSICTTRIIAGVGVPQLTAVNECFKALGPGGPPVIADGGVRHSGDITKALAAGASTVMLGSLFAGLEESPGEIIIYKGRSFKAYRGMGSIAAMSLGSRDRYRQEGVKREKLVPEGVEGQVPYKGRLGDFVYQLVGGLRSGMGYCGVRTLEELRSRTTFISVSAAGLRESHPHDITITREAPNYRLE